MVYFMVHGKFKKMYDIVACDYYLNSNTLILYEREGTRWIFSGVNSVKISEDIVVQTH